MKRSPALFLLLAIFSLFTVAHAQDLRERLRSIPGVSSIDSLHSTYYPGKYVFEVTQWLNPKDSTAGTFTQLVVLNHLGYDRPTLLVTEGYGASYALSEKYQEELSRLLKTNVVVVEHRYFYNSTPDSLNWDYLTAENSAYDLHHIRTLLNDLYPGKWISAGISKGGTTSLIYKAYFPDDVAFTVPYVAPLSRSLEDGRHEIFLQKVGTKKERRRIFRFQKAILKKRKEMVALLETLCMERNQTFRIPLDEVLDYTVLEYPFALWQWGVSTSTIPRLKSSPEVLFHHLTMICDPGYFAKNQFSDPFYVQAARELGYFGYDAAPLKKWLKTESSKGYFNRIFLPEGVNVSFDATLYNKLYSFLKENDPKMIFIYGETDPWTANRIPDFENKNNLQIYICPGGSHSTRIETMPDKMKATIIKQLTDWLQE